MFLPLEDARGRSLETFGRNRNMPRWEYLSGLTKVIYSELNIRCKSLVKTLSLPRNVNGALLLVSLVTMLLWLAAETTGTRRWMFWREQTGGDPR